MEIPVWPSCRTLDVGDKSILDQMFAEMQPEISELTFAGLYLFRTAHGYCLSRQGGSLVISGKGYDAVSYCLPPLGGHVAESCRALLDSGVELYGVGEQLAASLREHPDLEVREDRDSYDYLYLRSDLSDLPGNRFHKKKNRISYFAARHEYEVQLFSGEHLCGCLQLLDEWGRVAEVEGNRSFALEMDATVEALSMAELLGLEGIVIVVNGTVRAFAVGERLNRNTAVCHFEKADHFMEGLSQLVNREFARRLFNDCRYINREQDLGEPGLRNAKLSYHPVELLKKFRVRRLK